MNEIGTNNPVLAQASMAKTSFQVAQALDAIAGKLYALDDDVHKSLWVGLTIQPDPNLSDEQKVAAIDAIGEAILGHPGELREMSSGTYHHDADGLVGPVRVGIYASVTATEMAHAEDKAAQS